MQYILHTYTNIKTDSYKLNITMRLGVKKLYVNK